MLHFKRIYLLIAVNFCVYLVIASSGLKINDLDYLNGQGISVLAYHNYYYVGKQGGIEVIIHDKRIMTNGMVVYTINKEAVNEGEPEYFSQPIPETEEVKRIIDRKNNVISLPFQNDMLNLDYDVNIIGKGHNFSIKVKFNKMPDLEKINKINFEIELFPGIYRGKAFVFEDNEGIFPYNYMSPVRLSENNIKAIELGSGKKLTLAPENETGAITIEAFNGKMFLVDSRSGTDHNWFTLRTQIDLKNAVNEGFCLEFRPKIMDNYQKTPVLQYSQAGYHPLQKKKLVIEVDTNYINREPVFLYKFDHSRGDFIQMEQKKPELWGKYKRYFYLRYDFTHFQEEGLYYFSFNGRETDPFRINKNVYSENIWEPTIETFLPVQMCHMRIKDRNRIWHGVCHLDDALQAPTPQPFFDGFSQGEKTETPYKPLQTIPMLNQGGWHDAGDDDVNTNSTGRTVYHLALITEEFGIETDQTTIDFDKKEVYLHKPDGESDLIQNMKHGLNFILPQYETCGHGIVGVISNNFETYTIPGTWGHMTDNLFYNEEYDEDQKDDIFSGKLDDRYAFTNKDSRAEYRNAYVLAASGRMLQKSNPELAKKCLLTAEMIWQNEQNNTPSFYKSVGVPRDLREQQVVAATELFLTTKDQSYLQFVVSQKDYILQHMEKTAWTVSRIIDQMSNKKFVMDFEQQLPVYQDSLSRALARNPYGTYLDATLWGFGWDILWRTYKHYYLVKHYPDIFSIDPLVNCNDFMLGCHPYSNVSYVSGIGTQKPIPAFGMNRSDFYYIPGGVFSGVNIIEPDFPELLDNHPFIWQQSEYIIHGATPFVFTVLAVDKLLKNNE